MALFDDNGDRWIFVFVFTIGAAFIAGGLRFADRSPMRAGLLIAVGVIPSILLFWMVVPPLIALGVATYAVLNGRTRQRQLRAAT